MDTAHTVSELAAWLDLVGIKPGFEILLTRSYDTKNRLDHTQLDNLESHLLKMLDARELEYSVKAMNRGMKGASYVTITLTPLNSSY